MSLTFLPDRKIRAEIAITNDRAMKMKASHFVSSLLPDLTIVIRRSSLAVVAFILGTGIECVHADPRPSNITNKPGPVGELSLGCVPKGDAVTVYIRNRNKPPAVEDPSVLANFPNGFEKQTLQVGRDITPYDTLMVDELFRADGRQILRGHMVNIRGSTSDGTFYVYPLGWNCSLYVNPNRA